MPTHSCPCSLVAHCLKSHAFIGQQTGQVNSPPSVLNFVLFNVLRGLSISSVAFVCECKYFVLSRCLSRKLGLDKPVDPARLTLCVTALLNVCECVCVCTRLCVHVDLR